MLLLYNVWYIPYIITSSSTALKSSSSTTTGEGGGATAPNINQARPSNQTEEDIQLQLAIQMSKEHQDEQDRLRYRVVFSKE